METKALKDPRTCDWSRNRQLHARLAGIPRRIQRRRHLPRHAAGKLGNQRRRHRIHAERPQGREVEQRRRLHRRGRGPQHHPLVRRATSKATRWPAAWRRWSTRTPRQARDGAITVVDDHTVKLTLPAPDITIIAGMADYPAAVVHPAYDGGDPSANPVGTGPYLPETNEVGVKQVLVAQRRPHLVGHRGLRRPLPRPDRVHRLRHRPGRAGWPRPNPTRST